MKVNNKLNAFHMPALDPAILALQDKRNEEALGPGLLPWIAKLGSAL